MMSENFYSNLNETAFWRAGVVDQSPLALSGIYRKKWKIKPRWRIGTAGSCFAQHIARYMRQNGYNVMDVERAPMGLPDDLHHTYGYSMYSARYGNIYTTRQFRQLVEEVFSNDLLEMLIWEKDGRFYDALRPNIEPKGFWSEQEVIDARLHHIERLRFLFQRVDLFVFTMGLTEAWMHSATGRVVPLAPGVIAGGETAGDFEFVNFSYDEVIADFQAAQAILNANRKSALRFMLTVSPVPLTATASDRHILQASTYSKAVLRAAAGHLAEVTPAIDYFPSYEIITNPAARGTHFSGNLRSVNIESVDIVMNSFFAEHPVQTKQDAPKPKGVKSPQALQCEEVLLEAFKQ